MASYPPPGDCVHCGQFNRALTWDHVFPKSWYPDTTPPNLEKWQIPVCTPCNQEYGKLEDDLLLRIGLCLDPSDSRSSGITEKVIRALNPKFAKSAKDRRHREARRQKILRESFSPSKMPGDAFFPHFDRPASGSTQSPFGVRMCATHIEKLTIKIVKGITYLEDGYIIKDPYRIATFVLHDKDAVSLVSLLIKSGTTYAREPGIVVTRAAALDDFKTAVYSISIWSRLDMYAIVGHKDHMVPRVLPTQSSGA
jgi:hypothetical protein